MQPCIRAGVPFRVKNSYNPSASGTLITEDRGTEEPSLVSAITSKDNVQLVDIVSTRMLGQCALRDASAGQHDMPSMATDGYGWPLMGADRPLRTLF